MHFSFPALPRGRYNAGGQPSRRPAPAGMRPAARPAEPAPAGNCLQHFPGVAMFIPIPTGVDYTSTVTGSVLKQVRCEQCNLEYLYEMTRSARGEGTSLLFLDNEGAQ